MKSERMVGAAVIPQLTTDKPHHAEREYETRGLVEALDCDCAFVETRIVKQPNPAHLFGAGQLDIIRDQLDQNQCELLIVDGTLTPIQQRNLENQLGLKVIDRTGLILEIFGLRARTKAGRLQVELARLQYERSRLVRTWTHLERQRGGSGAMSGPGETQIEADRRMIDRALLRLKKQLSEVERTRRIQRQGRKAREVPIVALVGYTNAGKSTLFNRLSGASVFAQDMPFATLDPTIRKVELDNGKTISLVDTVGFITDLPTQLVEAFKSTLEETFEADIILHVHDVSSPDMFEQEQDVEMVLSDLSALLDIDIPPVIHVLNKTDKIEPSMRNQIQSRFELSGTNDVVHFSALTGKGGAGLVEKIQTACFSYPKQLVFEIPFTEGEFLAFLHNEGEVTDSEVLSERHSQRMSVNFSEIAFARLQKRYPSQSQKFKISE